MKTPKMMHALERTSPKGPGMPFIGTCWQCGKTGITLEQQQIEECENPAGLSQDDSLIMAVERGNDQ
jgi:hypothetical protein